MTAKVTLAEVYTFEAGIRDAVADVYEALFCEDAPANLTVEALVAKIRAAWLEGDAPCWEK